MSFDKASWEKNGYVVIPNVVSPQDLQAVVDAIWAYTGKSPDRRTTWYQEPLLEGAMVNMANNQPIWNNRQSPRFYEIFCELWGTEKLWVVLDRANLNPPVNQQWHHEGFLHWDMDPTKPPEPMFQGVLYLTDTSADMGGFQCVPGSHRRLLEWQATHSPEEGAPPAGVTAGDWMMKRDHPIKEWVMRGLEPKAIAGKAGDFLIWDVALLHGNGKNIADRPRMAQYISLTPEGTTRAKNLVHGGEALRQARIASWQDGPYPAAVATAFGVPEGLVDQWCRQILANPVAAQKVPTARTTPRLTAAQLQALPALLAKQQPWNAPDVLKAKPLGQQYGIGGHFLPVESLCQEIAGMMSSEFALRFEVEPAHLSDLGQKLLGQESW